MEREARVPDMTKTGAAAPLLAVRNLRKHYPARGDPLAAVIPSRRRFVRAVDGVSFDVARGETLGLVGESGCGKSTTGLAVMQLADPIEGEVRLAGRNIVGLPANEQRRLRREIQMVLQNPYSSLNPRLRVGDIIDEPLSNFGVGSRVERRERVENLLDRVGLSAGHADNLPHEFSGGQRQRIGIARALALQPRLLVLDEPVSALDVSVQAQILNLLLELKEGFGLTYLFISHDLGVVRYVSERIAVMYLGEIVEMGPANDLYDTPLHPYSQALMSAIPEPYPSERRKPIVLGGSVPSLIDPPRGCRFHTRCPIAIERCRQEKPELRRVREGREVRCHLVE
jgi:oligopeptide/dipeptide ABC transporter ATP-binding protein